MSKTHRYALFSDSRSKATVESVLIDRKTQVSASEKYNVLLQLYDSLYLGKFQKANLVLKIFLLDLTLFLELPRRKQ